MKTTSAARIPKFPTATAIICRHTNQRPSPSDFSWPIEITVIGALASITQFAVRFPSKRWKEELRIIAMDYLLVVFAILAVLVLTTIASAFKPYFLIYLAVILYSCDVLLIEGRQRVSWLPIAAIAAAAVPAVRGLVFGA